ncbi:vWA domain-containing protein [Hyalangium sp.]|uniref:vWA domain-containing protein n=1 Tax=Hyalangium sp. TaxID=2028555 RepID=UPI002D2514AB|nr:von Willebrand factor type A domain-containing protein [Hyalangium sp.]HYH96777.1 von Willebrand factor type A domain-containing protein [Hyalangium sp.]
MSKALLFTVIAAVLLVGAFLMFARTASPQFGARAQALAGSAEMTSKSESRDLMQKGMKNFAPSDEADALPAPTLADAPSPSYEQSPPQDSEELGRAAPVLEKKRQEVIQIIKGGTSQPMAATPSPEPLPTGNTHAAERPNPFTLTSEDAFSTFAVDVDTASYALFRRYVNEGSLPPRDSVRVEEWVNYFKYRLPAPTKGDFHVDLEGTPSPFTQGRHLLKVGLQGRRLGRSERKQTHLVFLVDTSGSMDSPDRLPLAQRSIKLAVDGLNETDTVAITTYAGNVREVLPPTPASKRKQIFAAVDSLSSGGGTAMGDGLKLAYQQAVKNAGANVVSRVIVLTDGDTNIGRFRRADDMLESVRGFVQEGVTLSTIGFGMGNYRDDLMERLANKGNGNCFYIDSEKEARRVFQEQLAGVLEIIAKDVKVQVEFDKAAVRGYRLVGYENRAIADQDFRNDKVDAGEIGAGHTVTALYEVELTGAGAKVATVRVRAKAPSGTEAAEQSFSVSREQLRGKLAEASSDMRFATAVAGTADILRGAPQASDWSLAVAEDLAQKATDGMEDREEFVSLLRRVREAKMMNISSGRTPRGKTY